MVAAARLTAVSGAIAHSAGLALVTAAVAFELLLAQLGSTHDAGVAALEGAVGALVGVWVTAALSHDDLPTAAVARHPAEAARRTLVLVAPQGTRVLGMKDLTHECAERDH